MLAELGKLGAEWVQIDEPVLVQDRSKAELDALERAYARLAEVEGAPKIVVATYFDHVGEAYPALSRLPVEAIALDFVRGERNRELIADQGWPEGKTLFAGVVSGRNVWINDLDRSIALLKELQGLAGRGDRRLELLLAAPLPDRQAQRAEPRRRGPELDVVRGPEARGAGGPDEGAERGRGGCRRRAGGQSQGGREPPHVSAHAATPPCATGLPR